MCAACGVITHVPVLDTGGDEPVVSPNAQVKFAALRNPVCRVYLAGGMLAMMADNIEHVITYWVLWQHFHSTALTGFEVISHWLPFLLLSPYFGALADRRDCRKLIQCAQVLFMSVSACWGILFATGTLRVWNACVLLILHGTAGCIWGPSEQLMLEDFVGTPELPSAVRLNSTARSLGILFGPVVGSALLLGLGPVKGIFCNILFYLPLTVLMARTKYTGHLRHGLVPKPRIGVLGSVKVFREVSKDRVLISMIILAGIGSFFVGASMQTVMPSIAGTMDGMSSGTAYGVLLFANGLGGVLGGLILEGTSWLRSTVRTAVWTTAVYGASTVLFAWTHNWAAAALLLVIGGICNLAAMSITQTIAQLLAPRAKRGQVVGVYGVSANGLRMGSGITVGFLGGVVGLRTSLGLSALALCACTAVVAVYLAVIIRRQAAAAIPPAADRLADGSDAGQDEVDAGQELLAVVVLAQLRRHLTHERVPRGVEARPPIGDGREEGRSICGGRGEAGGRGVLSGEAEDVVHERGRAVEPRSFGDAERLELPADAFEDPQHRGLPRLAGKLGAHPGVCVNCVEYPGGDGTDRLLRLRAADHLGHDTGDDVVGGRRE